MERYVAFLRGMNLGGRRITNEELKRRFEELDLSDVACFRASGNVIFDAEESDEAGLAEQIEVGLGKSLGYEVPVFLRNGNELRKTVDNGPFEASLVSASKGKLQVAFLLTAPKSKERKEALALASDEDRLAIDGRELYWLPSGGISESELDLKTLESSIGPWTMRTMGTVTQITAKHFA